MTNKKLAETLAITPTEELEMRLEEFTKASSGLSQLAAIILTPIIKWELNRRQNGIDRPVT